LAHPVEEYLKALRTTRMTGGVTDETASYPALKALLNAIGADLKPRVICELHPTEGVGIPDGALFAEEQIQRGDPRELLRGGRPARGVIEVKPTGDPIDAVVASDQVATYFDDHRQVLVTNYRDFVFLAQDAQAQRAEFGRFSLADSEDDFWALTAHPRKAANEQGDRFVDFMQRVMTHAAPLCDPEDVAWLLASYAREAMARVEAADIPALAALREALEEALGLTFEGEEGDHFFRSTLVQTLFYGIFSAWVIWSRDHPPTSDEPFDWHAAEWTLHVPMIAALYQQIAQPGKLRSLHVVEVLDWTADALNRVDRASFFAQFDEGQAVQYFYEPFLQAFDPELRKQLGVWYTPTEIVRYMVERVDRVLREELDVADGLADPNVYVLDPCCGTGAYLVEVLRRIERTLRERGGDALVAQDVKRAATERVFGFEILPAPFVVAHLQLGLTLRNLGAPLSHETQERAGVYLTNALTGWEPPDETKGALPFPEFEAEAEAADHVKREVPILVVLGNPPYNAFAGTSPEEEGGLVEPYKEGLVSEWGIKKFNLDDLYIRFFRVAERRIAEMQPFKGVVSFISNSSWVDGVSFVVLRKHLLRNFDRFWIENLHGDRKISERAPDGRSSQTAFAISGFSPGIQIGVAISTWVKSGKTYQEPVLYNDDIADADAEERREHLLDTLNCDDFDSQYFAAQPAASNRYSFRPRDVSPTYLTWPSVSDLALVGPYNAPVERRGCALISIDREPLVHRISGYFDCDVSDEEIADIYPKLMMTGNRIVGAEARKKLQTQFTYDQSCIVRYLMNPFDRRWCYWENLRPLFSEPSPELLAHHHAADNCYLVVRENSTVAPTSPPVSFSTEMVDYHYAATEARVVPFLVLPEEATNGRQSARRQTEMDLGETPVRANLSDAAHRYTERMGMPPAGGEASVAETVWLHVLATAYSHSYRMENEDAIRQDWPRVPLPDERGLLEASAELGREVAALLDTESGVAGVTEGDIQPELREMGVLSSVDGAPLQPEEGDLTVTAGWGYLGYRDATMPNTGEIVERDYTPQELRSIEEGAEALGLTLDEALTQLGRATCDIYLNERACWRNVPEGVWDYYIVGYQVVKKWLSYRERKVLGRDLRPEEARYVTEMVRRIAAILLLQPRLDENYRRIKAHTFDWSSVATDNGRAGA